MDGWPSRAQHWVASTSLPGAPASGGPNRGVLRRLAPAPRGLVGAWAEQPLTQQLWPLAPLVHLPCRSSHYSALVLIDVALARMALAVLLVTSVVDIGG